MQHAELEQDHLVGNGAGLLLVVRDEHGRHLRRALDAQDLFAHLDAQFRVKVGQRLVEQQQLRLLGQRPRNRHALLLAAGQLARLAPQQVRDPHELRKLRRALDPLFFRDALDLQREQMFSCTVMCGYSA